MSNFWLKVKIWTKSILIGMVVVYSLVFLIMNTGQTPVRLWFWYDTRLEISPLLLVFVMLVLGAVAALLVRAALTTISQIRESRQRSRTDRLEREMADMRQKAAMVRTRDSERSRPDEAQQD
jgi:uncharacterized integral membrane protein